MAKKLKYDRKREVRTYFELYKASKDLTNRARDDPKGSDYALMGAIVFCAFTFEAYLNHLGEGKLHLWTEKDFIKIWDKCNRVSNALGISPAFADRPYRTLKEVFDFRNDLAHGRSETLTVGKEVGLEYDPKPGHPKSSWENRLTLAFAERAMDDLSEVIKKMHVAAGYRDDYPFRSGVSMYSLKLGAE